MSCSSPGVGCRTHGRGARPAPATERKERPILARKQPKDTGFALPEELVSRRVAFAASGAAGTHADQNARHRHGAGRTNRVGSRSGQLRAALKDQGR
ncbi:hypothetical protein GCM10027090_02320 [Sinomonas soli]